MKRTIDKEKFKRFCILFKEYNEYYTKHEEAEVTLYLDEIAGGMLPRLLEEVFNAWFPELKYFCVVEQGEDKIYRYYGYQAFEVTWGGLEGMEEQYHYFEEIKED